MARYVFIGKNTLISWFSRLRCHEKAGWTSLSSSAVNSHQFVVLKINDLAQTSCFSKSPRKWGNRDNFSGLTTPKIYHKLGKKRKWFQNCEFLIFNNVYQKRKTVSFGVDYKHRFFVRLCRSWTSIKTIDKPQPMYFWLRRRNCMFVTATIIQMFRILTLARLAGQLPSVSLS